MATGKRRMTRKEIEEVWSIVKENAIAIQKLLEAHYQIREEIRELRESQKHTDKEIKELTESQKKTDEEIRELKEAQKKTDEQLRQTSVLINNTRKAIGDLGNTIGRLVEGLVLPSVKNYMSERGTRQMTTFQRAEFRRDGRSKEYDALVVDEDRKVILLFSAKTHAKSDHVDELLKDMEEFSFFTGNRYSGYSLMGAIAGITFGDGVDTYALKKGFFVFIVSEDVMTFKEPERIREVRL